MLNEAEREAEVARCGYTWDGPEPLQGRLDSPRVDIYEVSGGVFHAPPACAD